MLYSQLMLLAVFGAGRREARVISLFLARTSQKTLRLRIWASEGQGGGDKVSWKTKSREASTLAHPPLSQKK